jgi:hypothetical protein
MMSDSTPDYSTIRRANYVAESDEGGRPERIRLAHCGVVLPSSPPEQAWTPPVAPTYTAAQSARMSQTTRLPVGYGPYMMMTARLNAVDSVHLADWCGVAIHPSRV